MSKLRPKFSITEALLCAWVIGAHIWYLLQFRPLFAVFAAKFFHKT